MSKSDVVKLRIEPQRKQAWKEYAENCLPALNLTDLVTIAVDYFVSGKHYSQQKEASGKIDEYALSWVYPKALGSETYLEVFLEDAEKELNRKKDRNAKRLACEYD